MVKKILVIIPAYNEKEIILKTIQAIQAETSNSSIYQYDLLIIDDASTDGTTKLLKNQDVPALFLPINLGLGGAIQTGYLYAMEFNYDAAIQVDSDGQHEPADIPKLIEHLFMHDVDMVLASRFIKKTNYKASLPRSFGMKFVRKLLFLTTKKKIFDTTSGFRAVKKDLFEFFSKNYVLKFPDVVILIMALKNGFKILEIDARFHHRTCGDSLFNLSNSLYYPFCVFIKVLEILTRPKKYEQRAN